MASGESGAHFRWVAISWRVCREYVKVPLATFSKGPFAASQVAEWLKVAADKPVQFW